jgi:hypothetical protein
MYEIKITYDIDNNDHKHLYWEKLKVVPTGHVKQIFWETS